MADAKGSRWILNFGFLLLINTITSHPLSNPQRGKIRENYGVFNPTPAPQYQYQQPLWPNVIQPMQEPTVVAFTYSGASNSGREGYLSYQTEVLNQNAIFNRQLGIFCAETPGTYMFLYSLLGDPSTAFCVSLRRRNTTIATSYSDNPSSGPVSKSVKVNLNKGETIYLMVEQGQINEYKRTSSNSNYFSGVLLDEEDTSFPSFHSMTNAPTPFPGYPYQTPFNTRQNDKSFWNFNMQNWTSTNLDNLYMLWLNFWSHFPIPVFSLPQGNAIALRRINKDEIEVSDCNGCITPRTPHYRNKTGNLGILNLPHWLHLKSYNPAVNESPELLSRPLGTYVPALESYKQRPGLNNTSSSFINRLQNQCTNSNGFRVACFQNYSNLEAPKSLQARSGIVRRTPYGSPLPEGPNPIYAVK